jgi:PAS domain S-box-containing protein
MGPDKKKSGASRRRTPPGDSAPPGRQSKAARGARSRKKAEEAQNDRADSSRLRQRTKAPLEAGGGDIADLSPSEARKLLHELQDAQLELERQNEELRAAQQESEGRYRLLAETATDVVWLADLDFECSYISPSVEQLLGYTVDEIMAMSIQDVVTPSSLAQFRAIAERERLLEGQGAGAAKQSLVLEQEMIRKDGATVDVETTVALRRDADGRFAHIVGVTRNVEERRGVEKVLRASERRLRVALDAVSDGVWDYDVVAGKIHTGQRCLDLLGYPPHEMGDTVEFWWDLVHPDDQARMASLFKDHMEGKTSRFEAELRLRDAEGCWLWILGQGQVTAWDTDLKPTRILGTLTEINSRKEAEAQVRLLSSVVEQSTVSMAIANLDGYLTFANGACSALYGYAPEEMLGKHLSMLHRPEDMPIVDAANERLRETGRFAGVIPCRRRDGRVFPCMMRNALLRDENDSPIALVGAFDDISERLRHGHASHEREEQQRLAIENMPVLVNAFDEDGTIIVWNLECERVTGYAAEEIVGNPHAMDMLYPDPAHRESVVASIRRQEADAREKEFGLTRKDGGTRTISWSNVSHTCPIPGWAVWAVGVDVTDRVEFEARLRDSEARLKQAMQGADLGMWEREISTGRLVFNDRWAEILGHSPDEITPHMSSWQDRIHPEDRAETLAAMNDHLEGRIPFYEGEFRMRTKTGDWRWILSRGRVVERDAEGRPLRTAGTHLDISARKEAERKRRKIETQMQQTQKLESLGVLAGGIAHDFNNILMAIMGNADLVLQDLAKDSPLRPRIEEVEKASRRAVTLTHQMLAYSGKGRLVTRPIDLGQAVAEIAHLLRSSFQEGVLVTLNLGENLPAIRADSAQIQQVVMNLLLNASEAFADHSQGDITVSTGVREYSRADLSRTYLDEGRPEGSYVYLEVADTGCGMDEEVLSRIFDPFYSTKFTGRGLGLAALLGIVRGHNGAVMVQSAPGSGSTITVLFPALDGSVAEAQEEESPLSELAWTGSGTVLLVDDEDTVLEVSSRMLERIGLKVLTATDGCEALEVFRERGDEIDCILLDLTMPNMGGEQAYHALRALRKDVPIVLSSGFGEQELAERFAEHDITGIIHKPYKTAALTALMRDVLDR